MAMRGIAVKSVSITTPWCVPLRGCASSAAVQGQFLKMERKQEQWSNLAGMSGRDKFERHTRIDGSEAQFQLPRLTSEQASVAKEMSEHKRRGRWQEALAAFHQVAEPEPRLTAAALDALAKGLQEEKAWNIFNSLPQKTSLHYNAMFILLGRVRKSFAADRLWEEMATQGITPDNASYTTMITAHGASNNIGRCVELFAELERSGLRLDQTEYGCMLGACGKSGDSDRAWELYQRMLDAHVVPHVGHITSLVVAHASRKLEEGARKAFAEIRRHGLQPDVVAYTAMGSCFSGDGQLAKVEALQVEMEQDRIVPNVFFFNQKLRSAGDEGLDERCDQILAEFEQRGLQRNMQTDTVMRSVEVRKQRMRKAPADEAKAARTPEPEAVLPAGWQSALEPTSGMHYYWSTADPAGTTTWERPV